MADYRFDGTIRDPFERRVRAAALVAIGAPPLGSLGLRSGKCFFLGLALGALASVTLPSRGAAQGMPPSLATFLQQSTSFTPQEVSSAASGTPVVKELEPSDSRELAFVGVVRVDVPRAFYVKHAADFESSLRDPSRPSFALFSDPAAASDVAAFWLPHADVQDLAKCRPGSCMLKLPTPAIIRLSESIDPNSTSADTVATEYFRAGMIEFIGAYRLHGNGALLTYGDRPDSDATAKVWDGMLSRSPYMYQYAPSLERYIRNYPQDRPAVVREALFWSLDDLPPLRPMLTLTHAIVYEPPELPSSTLIVAKQLYCDHYLDGGMDLTAIVDQARDQAATGPGIYVVYLRRIHFDNLPTGGLINVRATVIGKLRDRTMTFLRNAKAHNEHDYATLRPSSP